MSRSRRLATVAAVAFAIGTPALQALGGWGLSAEAFSAAGDSTLRAAGYAFSIWTVIYAGLIAYAVHQALPRNASSPLLNIVGWPAVLTITGCGAWLWASAADARWATVAIIVGSAALLVSALVRASRETAPRTSADHAFVIWPLALLAGWLTIAAAINILTVLTAEDMIGPAPRAAAYLGIAAVMVIGLAVLRATGLAAYGVPIAWGFVAVWVAERAGKPGVAAMAAAAAVIISAYAVWQSARKAPRSAAR